jgi:hypothetical protein
LAAQDVP